MQQLSRYFCRSPSLQLTSRYTGQRSCPWSELGFDDPALTNRLISDCFAANRSTANRDWAVTYFSGFTAKKAKECDRVAINGVSFVHDTNRHWREV